MSNLADILEQRLAPEQMRRLKAASEAAERRGMWLYLVGGTVRDMLLGQALQDLDVSVYGATPGLLLRLAEDICAPVEARSQFGTLKLRLDGTAIDLAMTRRETYVRPGALPTVEPGSVEEDMARRDFSINAMGVSLAADTWGELIDPFDGRGDLERGLVRVLHSRSFVDDATRMLRAVRYVERLGFRLEDGTESLVRRDLSYLDTISGDRIRHELERVFLEEAAADMLALAQELGVLAAIHPALRLSPRTLESMRHVPLSPQDERALLFMALLAFEAPQGQHPVLIARLRLDSRWSRVVSDTGAVKALFDRLAAPEIRPSVLYYMLRPFDAIAIRACALAAEESVVSKRLERYLSELRYVRTALRGNDIIALGVPSGPEVGKLLGELLTARLDGMVASREDEEAFVRRAVEGGAE